MATFGLWYLRWDQNRHKFRSFMEYQGDTEIDNVQKKLREVGINYIVVLDTGEEEGIPHGEGRDMLWSNDPENDAYMLSEFLGDNMTMPYYVEIPYYKYRSEDARGLNYWKEWVKTFMKSSDPNLKGFYWNFECPMMFSGWEAVISELANIIHRGGFEFIWIPYMHYTSKDTIERQRVFNPGSYRHHAAYYFDWVFLQPNYYQGKLLPAEISTLQTWKDNIEDVKEEKNLRNYKGIDNIYYEFECDNAVLSSPTYRERACDYVRVLGKPPQRAYYFGTDVKALEYLNGVCNYV